MKFLCPHHQTVDPAAVADHTVIMDGSVIYLHVGGNGGIAMADNHSEGLSGRDKLLLAVSAVLALVMVAAIFGLE